MSLESTARDSLGLYEQRCSVLCQYFIRLRTGIKITFALKRHHINEPYLPLDIIYTVIRMEVYV